MQATEPQPLRVMIFSFYNTPVLSAEDTDRCLAADLVVSLGGVGLDAIAAALPPDKAALAVLGPRDERNVPKPFLPLHGNGFNFRGWRIAGFSGAPRGARVVPGNYVSETEASGLLRALPPCDIFFTHSPPATLLRESGVLPEQGFDALDEYIQTKPPLYHFYAHPTQDSGPEDIQGKTLSIGISGVFDAPPLKFF